LLEALRIVREEEPPRPSTRLQQSTESREIAARRDVEPSRLQSSLRGELDWIAMKCLEKERARRYEHAGDLAADLCRYLAGEPVAACPPSPTYRLRKWVRKRPALTALMALAIIAPLLLVAVGFWYNRVLTQKNREITRQSADIARERDDADAARREESQLRGESEGRERAIRRDLYATQLSMAGRAWENGRVSLVHEVLESTRPNRTAGLDLRGWEWFHLYRRSRSALVRFQGHAVRPRVAVFSPEGKIAASGDESGQIVIWDAASGAELQRYQMFADAILALRFSHDGKLLAASSRDCNTVIFDCANGQPKHWLRGHALPANCLAFGDKSRLLATGGADNVIKIWDVDTGQEIRSLIGHTNEVQRLWIHENGRRLASIGDDYMLRFWNLDDGKEDTAARRAGVSTVCSVNHDFTRIALWNPSEGALQVRELPGGKVIVTNENRIIDVAWSADGKWIVTANRDGNGVAVDVGMRRVLAEQMASVNTVAFAPARDRVISVCGDGSIRIWSAVEDNRAAFVGHLSGVRRVAISPDGETAATGDLIGNVRLWNVRTGEQRHSLGLQLVEKGPEGTPAPPEALTQVKGKKLRNITTYSPPAGGKYFEDSVRVVKTYEGHYAEILGLVFSPDGKWLASASGDATVRIWDVSTGREVKELVHPRRVSSVVFAPKGDALYTGCWDGGVRIWSLPDGVEKKTIYGHADLVDAIVLHPDGKRLASAGADRIVRIWDLDTGVERHKLVGHTGLIHALAISPDGRLLASGSSDQTIRCWDFETGALRATMLGHKERVGRCIFLPQGHRLVSVSGNAAEGLVRIWDAEVGREILSLPTPAGTVHDVAFDMERQRLMLTAGRAIDLWDGAPPVEMEPKRGDLPQPVRLTVPADAGLKVLGYDRMAKLKRIHSGPEIEPKKADQDFLVIIVSAPHSQLYPTDAQIQSLRDRSKTDPDIKPPGPRELYSLYDPSRFGLVLSDGQRLPCTIGGPVPHVFESAGGFNDRITMEASTSPYHRHDRSLIALAWEMPKAQTGPYQVRFDLLPPEPVPDLRLPNYIGRHRWGVRRSDNARGDDIVLEQRTTSIFQE